MKNKAIFLLFLSFLICISFNCVFAIEFSDNSTEYLSDSSIEDIVLNTDFDSSLDLANDLETNLMDNGNLEYSGISKVIYVDSNNNKVGNGSYDNPFTTFKEACDSVNGENNVTIYVSEGTYELGEGFPADASEGSLNCLKFNTNNLNIIGNGKVIIKNKYDYEGYNAEAFSLTSSSANFTFINLIFDASNRNWASYVDFNDGFDFFMPFFGEADLGVFDNCSFIGFAHKAGIVLSEMTYNSKFINCYFECGNTGLFEDDVPHTAEKFTLFENSIINIKNPDGHWVITRFYVSPSINISMNNVWLGQNELPDYIKLPTYDGSDLFISINRYAIFNITQNYLGNNQYEILGKLTWNGTDDQDGMENFQPMTVKLTSNTGEINATATLVNGNFRTVYTSSNTNHKINYILDNVDEYLEFVTVNITSKEASIYYGEDQNITVNLTQAINNNIAIVVSNATFNKTYIVKVNDSSSFTYTIPDRLKAGTYDINIILSEGNFVGFNTTTLTVSKVSDYTFEVVPNSPKFGENATITITLPDDVNGTVIVKLGNETLPTLEANQTIDVNFAKLNVDTYNITVTYSGSDKYTQDEKTASLTVDPAESSIEINDAAFTYGETIAIPFNMTNAIGVNVTVYNKDDDEVATASSTSGIITLDTLPAGEYSLYVKTVVDDEVNYQWADATVSLTINKANSTLEISDQEFAYATEAVINAVTLNSTGNLIATLTDENNNEIQVTVSGDNITLPLLDVGKYTLNVTTNVDENHNNVTKSATVTIIKTTPLMNVTVEPTQNITAKDNPTLTIKLPSDSTGEVVVKVNGKKVQDSSANETITINLNNAPGDYVVEVIYSGDKNYESDSKTKEFTISKAETTITAKQINFEEGNASKIEVTVPNVESGIVLVDVEGKKFYGDIKNGKANITLEGLPEGNYTANIKFFGDEIYKEATCTASVKVSEPKIITELKEQLADAQANATQLKDELDNVSGQLVDAQANATQLKEDLNALNQTVAGKDAVIGNLTDVVAGKDAVIGNLTDVVAGKDAEIRALNDTVNVLRDIISNNVTVVIDGVSYSAKVNNGTITIKTNASDVKTERFGTTILAKDFEQYAIDVYAGEKGGYFKVQLVDDKGKALANKPVKIGFNGVVYNKTTDENGWAQLQINLAQAGEYTFAIAFLGDDDYNASFVVQKIIVKQKKTSISASAKSFKANAKTKSYTVTLKTDKGSSIDGKTYLNKGKKVSITINGKTYTAKTNSKGQATFKLSITKKGKYTAIVKFEGDNTYLTSSKSVKITIK